MSKRTVTICIDDDLIPIANELQSRRQLSAFVQDCLRSHKKIIEAESLEEEKKKIQNELKEFQNRLSKIDERLEEVKEEAKEQKDINDLEVELRRLNSMKKEVQHWDQVPMSQRPKSWHEWNNKRNAVAKSLKDAGFDFSRLRSEEKVLH